MIARIEALIRQDVAGDPCSSRRWTRGTTRKISGALRPLGIEVSSRTVARLLKSLHYSLHANRKELSRGGGAGRDEQFQYIGAQRTRFAQEALPVVSVDTKKRELIGNFKNPGAVWGPVAEPVNDHDFRSDALGIAIPWGLYDERANRGALFVGTSHDTPEFAADNLARWWRTQGRRRYPGARELLLLADGGGSNGARNRAFKHGLQTRLCDPYGLRVTVCHYPTGASKWNPIEHRLFSEISKNWAGCPLRSYETMLRYIRATRTETGLRVTARLIEREYATGVHIPDPLMATLHVHPHAVQPLRNYTISPRT